MEKNKSDQCLKKIKTPMKWSFAKAFCETEGGRIVSIPSLAYNERLSEIVGGNKKVWIGYNDKEVEGRWVGTDGFITTIGNWELGATQTFNRNKNCAFMYAGKFGGLSGPVL